MRTATQATWNVSPLASGIHFLSIETDSGKATLKFVKS
jgi:hypothetical protein